MNFIRTITSLFLASLVLIASIGVTINSHWCMGEVKSVAFFVKANPCKACGESHHERKNGCCEEKSVVLKGKVSAAQVVKSTVQINPSFNLIGVILPVLYLAIDADSAVTSSHLAHYKPPLIEHDITLLVQSFLI